MNRRNIREEKYRTMFYKCSIVGRLGAAADGHCAQLTRINYLYIFCFVWFCNTAAAANIIPLYIIVCLLFINFYFFPARLHSFICVDHRAIVSLMIFIFCFFFFVIIPAVFPFSSAPTTFILYSCFVMRMFCA